MSSPLEGHETASPSTSDSTPTAYIGVDDEISMLNNNEASNNNVQLDPFMGQVSDYNFNSGNNNNNNNNNIHFVETNENNNNFDSQQQNATENNSQELKLEQFEFAKPNQPNKKGKQKSKDGGHSSFLHVFTNPLMHAIPILARNCLNFEDFLAQTSMPGQSLLGPNEIEEDQESNFMSPTVSNNDSPWHIRVLGLPHTGAKSRVETQIRICVQLVDTAGELVTNWSHIKLPEHLVVKDKAKLKNQKYGKDETTTFTDNQVLTLEATVVCDGQPNNEIIMCKSCVHRERKRLKRKRDNKVARAANKEGGAAKLAALFANDLPDLNDDKVMTEERRRILLFNCNEYIEFNTGEATIPTRITCYCRHHSEKKGFRIVFKLKDSSDHVIATGRSPPIMITDDHKSSKMQQAAAARKRALTDMDASATESDAPSTSKRKITAETDSVVSSPHVSNPATPSSQPEEVSLTKKILPEPDNNPQDNISFNMNMAEEKQQSTLLDHNNEGDFIHQLQNPNSFNHNNTSSSSNSNGQMSQGELLDLLNSHDYLNILSNHNHTNFNHFNNANSNSIVDNNVMSSMLSVQPTSNTSTPSIHPHQQSHDYTQFNQNNVHGLHPREKSTSMLMNNTMMYQQKQKFSNHVYAKLQEKTAIEGSKSPNLPRLHRLIPSEGPIYGGAEITILGSNFYEGLTCLFGENPAIPTHCWSTNTLLCILPPAASAGPVVVSFKEHPLMLDGQDAVLFTYYDESDRALMELALQVVGLKTMGKVEDARQVAMRIVQGDNRKENSNVNQQHRHSTQFKISMTAAAAIYENARTLYLSRLEEHITATILALDQMKHLEHRDHLSLTNSNQHTLLHLATICGYTRLVKTLISLNSKVNETDQNGFTALHFACWFGKIEIASLLIDSSNLKIMNHAGKTAEMLAVEAGHHDIVELFKGKKIKSEQPVKLINYIPTKVVNFTTSLLSTKLSQFLHYFYKSNITTKCTQRVANFAGQLYKFKFDPF